MTKTSRMTHVLLALVLVPGVVAAQRTSYDYQRNANFSQLRTFDIKPGEKLSENPLVNERIMNAIAAELSARGMERSANPDVLVIPSMTSETRQEVTAYNAGFGMTGQGREALP